MNLLDILILVGVGAAALGGYRLGFLARVSSWIGLGIGLTVAARLLPKAIDTIRASTPNGRLLTATVVLIGGAFAGQAIGLLIGARLRSVIPIGPLRWVDRSVGAGIGALGVLISVWLLLPSMADVPGVVSRQARNSRFARAIDQYAPAAPDTLQALRRLVGEDNFPRVFDALTPARDPGPAPADSGLPVEVRQRVALSTVKVEGGACNRIQDGSGFTVAPGYVVTNAHVVAGESNTGRRPTVVFEPQNPTKGLPATVVLYDPDRDLAVLHVPTLKEPVLQVFQGDPAKLIRSTGAVFGHPRGVDEIVIAPATISEKVDARGRDLYDRHGTDRDVFIMASSLQPGDSGGALVDTTGSIIGVAFAIAPDRANVAYALTTAELRPVLSKGLGLTAAVSTQACLTG